MSIIPSQPTGIINYKAPKQLDGDIDSSSVTSKSDIWAMGCTMLFMLTGKPPVEQKTYNQVIKAVSSLKSKSVGLQSCQHFITCLIDAHVLHLWVFVIQWFHHSCSGVDTITPALLPVHCFQCRPMWCSILADILVLCWHWVCRFHAIDLYLSAGQKTGSKALHDHYTN